MRPPAVVVLTVAVVLATIAFAIGAALERATLAETHAATASQESAGGEAAGSSETSGGSTAATGETVLGFNPEATPVIVAASIGSLALAGGVWLYWRRPPILWLVTAAMTAFGVLDVVEVVHQVTAQHPALIAVAAVVAILHGTAAVLALRLALKRARLEPAAA